MFIYSTTGSSAPSEFGLALWAWKSFSEVQNEYNNIPLKQFHGWGAPDPSDDQGWPLPTLTPRHHRPVLNIILLLSNRSSVRGNRTQSRSSCDTPRHHKHRDSTSSCAQLQDPFVRTKSLFVCEKKCKPSCKTGCSHHILFCGGAGLGHSCQTP